MYFNPKGFSLLLLV